MFASLSPDIAAAREKAEAVRGALAPPVATESAPTNADLMAKLDKMSESMVLKDDLRAVQLETVQQMRSEFQSEMAPVRVQLGQVEANTKKALDETKALNERLVAVEQAKIQDERKFAEMNAAIKRLDERLSVALSSGSSFRRDKFDPALQRIRFVG